MIKNEYIKTWTLTIIWCYFYLFYYYHFFSIIVQSYCIKKEKNWKFRCHVLSQKETAKKCIFKDQELRYSKDINARLSPSSSSCSYQMRLVSYSTPPPIPLQFSPGLLSCPQPNVPRCSAENKKKERLSQTPRMTAQREMSTSLLFTVFRQITYVRWLTPFAFDFEYARDWSGKNLLLDDRLSLTRLLLLFLDE